MSTPKISKQAQEMERQFRDNPVPLEFDLDASREATKDYHIFTGTPPGVLLEWETNADVVCLRMRPQEPRSDREVILIHGGGYCLMSAMTHHRFAGHLANALDSDVVVIDYGLAPEHPYPAGRDQCVAVLSERRRAGPAQQILIGESAGGGLALSSACALRDRGAQGPDAMVLMSPWLDLSLNAPDMAAGRIDDAILNLPVLQACADLYLAGRPPTDPGASPFYANLAGLSPTVIQTAGNDLLREDSERLIARWPEESVVEHHHFEGMQHSFQMFAGNVPEADHAIDAMATAINQFLDPSKGD